MTTKPPPSHATVDIRPGVSVLAMLRHVNYKPWHALAEFVDNAVESRRQHLAALQRICGRDYVLEVRIDIDRTAPVRISIRDNAAGIFFAEYQRAFRPAAVPIDRSGLAEFGMGMKSAACWFAPNWSVHTSALGENVARSIRFDIDNIVNDEIEELQIEERSALADVHYTEIVLDDVFHVPQGRTIGKLKSHLADIYRDFIRKDLLRLYFRGERLTYTEPTILAAPYFRRKKEDPRTWRKNITFDFGGGLAVTGFGALRAKGNTAKAGFALFRRGRVIQGSADEGYRPAHIFGRSNSYRYQRLFGELHLEGFEVSHTKDGFRWDDNEEPFLELLREHLDSEEMPLLKQAEGYRVQEPSARVQGAAEHAVNNVAEVLERELPGVLEAVADAEPVGTPTAPPAEVPRLANRELRVRYRGSDWVIVVELTQDSDGSEWVSISDQQRDRGQPRRLGIRVSMAHPFMVQFAQTDVEDLEAMLRIAAAITLSEVLARDAGVRRAGTVRRNINELLRDALSEPP